VDFLISIGVAAKNDNVIGGSSSAAFAALWSFFVALLFSYGGSHLVFIGNGSALMVGFVIGASFMLSQLFFVLMCIFFTYGSTAKTDHIGTLNTTSINIAISITCMAMKIRRKQITPWVFSPFST